MPTTTRTRPQRLLATAAITLLFAGGAAACSGSGSDDATTTTKVAERTTITAIGPEDTTPATVTDDPTVTTDPDETTTTEGGGGGGTSKQAYVDAFVESFNGTDEIISADDAECVGNKIIDVIGYEDLRDSGLSPEDFGQADGEDFPDSLGIDEDKANELYDQFGACDVSLGDAFIKALDSEDSLTADQKDCLADKITDDTLRESFVANFLGEDADDPLDAATECVGDVGGGTDSPTANTLTPSTVG